MFLIEPNPGISNIGSLSALNKNDVLPSRWEKIIIRDLDRVPHPWEIEVEHLAASISEKKGCFFFSLCRPSPCVYPLASSAFFLFLGAWEIMRISERLTSRLRFSTEKPCQSLNQNERWVLTLSNCLKSEYEMITNLFYETCAFSTSFKEKLTLMFSRKVLFFGHLFIRCENPWHGCLLTSKIKYRYVSLNVLETINDIHVNYSTIRAVFFHARSCP